MIIICMSYIYIDIDNYNILWWVWDQVPGQQFYINLTSARRRAQEPGSRGLEKSTETPGDSGMFGGYPAW